MRRRKLKTLIYTVLLSLFIFLVNKVVGEIRQKQKLEQSIRTIPPFNFKTVENKNFTTKHLKLGVPTVFLYFNSECEFCHHEAHDISSNYHMIENVQIVLVSTESRKKIKNFSEEYHLDKKPNITFVYDTTSSFSKIFKPSSIPFNLIYDKDKKLLETQKGPLTVQGLLKIIN